MTRSIGLVISYLRSIDRDCSKSTDKIAEEQGDI